MCGPGCARFTDGVINLAACVDGRAVGDFQVSGYSNPASEQAVFSDCGAAGNTAGCRNGRMGSDPHIVRDLAEVIDPDVFFQHGVTDGAPVDAAVGADLAIVSDDHRADLRHLFPVIRGESDAETVGADHGARDAP